MHEMIIRTWFRRHLEHGPYRTAHVVRRLCAGESSSNPAMTQNGRDLDRVQKHGPLIHPMTKVGKQYISDGRKCERLMYNVVQCLSESILEDTTTTDEDST